MLMVMLRNNSRRAVSSKQGHMADNRSFPSPIQSNTNKPISSFLASPRFFNGLLTKILSDVDSEISPKSILESKQMFNLGNPFGYDRNCANSITYIGKKPSTLLDNKLESEGIKLALLDPIENEENINTISKANCRMVLFGTELKIQNPSVESPTDFGIKTRDSQLLASFTEFGTVKEKKDSSRGIADGLSLREMENSEDYTCVITHGPNPKTTHIFDNCVVESCSVFGKLSELKKENQCSC